MTNILPFGGKVALKVEGQSALPVWQQKIIRDALENGEGGDGTLRFGCRIALDANKAFERLETSAGTYHLNPSSPAQFGRNQRGQAFLTLGLVDEANGDRYRLTWEGDAVPLKVMQVAVKHDEGRKVGDTTIQLDVSEAQVWKLGPIKPQVNRRKSKSEPRRKYTSSRLCAKDYAEQKAARIPMSLIGE